MVWGAIAAVGQKVIGDKKEEGAQHAQQAQGMAQNMMGQSQQQMQQGLSMDYTKIPSFQDFTSFK
ncbi:hypothetical protein AB4342_01365 [Vibrio breoganii]